MKKNGLNNRRKKWLYAITMLLLLIMAAGGITLCARQNKLDRSLLEYVERDNYNQVKKVLDEGADPNAKHYDDFIYLICNKGQPVIFYALYNAYNTGNLQLLKLLLDRGANPNVFSLEGNPPLTYYAELEQDPNWKIIQLLLNKGVDSSVILPAAVAFHKNNFVKQLLDKGANIEYVFPQRGIDRYTPLFIAVQTMQPDMVMLLLERGARANAIGWRYNPNGSYTPVTIDQILEEQRFKNPHSYRAIKLLLDKYR